MGDFTYKTGDRVRVVNGEIWTAARNGEEATVTFVGSADRNYPIDIVYADGFTDCVHSGEIEPVSSIRADFDRAVARMGGVFGVPGFPYKTAFIVPKRDLAPKNGGLGVVRLYLAGPMTGYPEFNFPAFHAAAATLRAWGFEVENPAERDEQDGFDPKVDQAKPHSYYMAIDLPLVCEADAVVVLDGWEASSGARMETAIARALGKPVVAFETLASVVAPEIVLPSVEGVAVETIEAASGACCGYPDDCGDPCGAFVPSAAEIRFTPPTTIRFSLPAVTFAPEAYDRIYVGIDGGPAEKTTAAFIGEHSDGVLNLLGFSEAEPGDDLFVLDPDRGEAVSIDEAPAMIEAESDALADGTKPTNPKDTIGSSKIPVHLWPETATMYGALALLDGALKYGRSNWREAGVRASIYSDAFRRHVGAWIEGEDLDPDSGVPHLGHALACIAIIIDADAHGMLVDDRQYAESPGYRSLVEKLTPHVARLKEKHAGRSPRHYTIADVAAPPAAL